MKRWLWFGLGVLACWWAGMAQAVCPPPLFQPARALQLAADVPVLIVTHASATFDPRYSAKYGIDQAIRFARDNRIPRIYLVDESPFHLYYMDDCEPEYWVQSQGGEVEFEVVPRHIYVVGGHVELCLSRSLHDIIYQWSRQPARDLSVTFFIDALYSNGRSVEETDPYHRDFDTFMGVVTYGRPGGERWPKLNLLEMMGVIKQPENDLLYLEKILPRWDRTFPADYRVELRLNDDFVKVLRRGAGLRPPTLTFRFIDSAEPR